MQRRSFITLIGGGVVVAALGAGGFVATRTPSDARAPWARAGGPAYADPRLNALSYAILAPNPHNRQPWLIELLGEDSLVVHFDQARQLPNTDPFDRQLTIGLGCFLELLRMAAMAQGMAMEMTPFPDGSAPEGLDDRPVAHVRFRHDAAAAPDPLWQFVPDRRSNKSPYDTSRPVPPRVLRRLLAVAGNGTHAGGSVDASDIADWRALTETALTVEIETPRTWRESVELLRIGKREISATPDGIALSGPVIEALNIAGLFTRAAALDRTSLAYQQSVADALEACRTAMGHLWLVTPGNSRIEQIAAGADWLRINLAATRAGLAIHPYSQALQEYPEMDAPRREVHERLTPDGGRVQMLGRLGYAEPVPPTPRWPLETRLVTA
jgi:hypothetical protein